MKSIILLCVLFLGTIHAININAIKSRRIHRDTSEVLGLSDISLIETAATSTVSTLVPDFLDLNYNSNVYNRPVGDRFDDIIANNDVAANYYSVVGNVSLPKELCLNPLRGYIKMCSATWNTMQAPTEYKIQWRNRAGATGIVSVKIGGCSTAPKSVQLWSLGSQRHLPVHTWTYGSPTDTLYIAVPNGDCAATTFSVSPDLPQGVYLDECLGIRSGLIFGTPTKLLPATNYTITATNKYGSVSTNVLITVKPVAPANVIYSSTKINAFYGIAISPITTTQDELQTITFSIKPNLPAGLTLDSKTGRISGTPTVAPVPLADYTVTASNSAGSTSAVIQIIVNVVAPSGLVLSTNKLDLVYFLSASNAVTVKEVRGGPASSLVYTISPSLPQQLSIDRNTGTISGVPTVISDLKVYTVTATNSAGSTSAIVSIQVTPSAPTSLTLSTIAISATYGVAITPVTVVSVVGGPLSTLTFSISPGLPKGLKIDLTTGVISGTPTVSDISRVYKVTAQNSAGSATASITIIVNVARPNNLVLSTTSVIAYYQQPITPITVVRVDGGPAESIVYSVSPALPNGLTINDMGTISGTPSLAPFPSTTYTVMARNEAGFTTATFTFVIQVTKITTITYSTTNIVINYGSQITTVSPISSVGGPLSSCTFSISPSLPNGLNFNPTNGQITGTPTVVISITTYTITVSNTAGSTSITIQIQVKPTAPEGISLSSSSIMGTYNIRIIDVTVSFKSGGPDFTFSISPSLPAGLILNTKTGTISGTPLEVVSSRLYVLTATNPSGSSSVSIVVEIKPAVPTILVYNATTVYATYGVAISYVGPASVLGGPLSTLVFSISPALPAGLTFNPSKGVISGTPTAVSPLTIYTITATNSVGFTIAYVSIVVNVATPFNLVYSQTTIVSTYGVAITPLVVTSVQGGPLSSLTFSASSLPSGLSINSATGTISGIPSTPTPQATYVVVARNNAGSITVSIIITILPAAPKSLIYPSNNVTCLYNRPLSPFSPISVSGGPLSSLTFSISPSLPQGLTFSTVTGSLSGTPTQVRQTITYRVTASNTAGSVTTEFLLTVLHDAPSNFTYEFTSFTFTYGIQITPVAPTVNMGGIAVTFSCPNLPQGIILNPSTGAISGIPQVAPISGQYTIRAENAVGYITFQITIIVNVAIPSSFQFTTSSVTLVYGVPVWQSLTVRSISGGPSSSLVFSISPALPDGLVFDTKTGSITGTPNVAPLPSQQFTITARNNAGSASTSLSIAIIEAAPKNLRYSTDSITAVFGETTVNVNVVSVSGGPQNKLIFSIVPNLPNGLTLSATGTISGVPKTVLPPTRFTILASNSAGVTYALIIIQVTEAKPAYPSKQPEVITYTFNVDQEIVPFKPFPATGTPSGTISYSISPGLSSCLTLDPNTGVLSGTPKYPQSETVYTITAYNSAGKTTLDFKLVFALRAPSSLSYGKTSFSFYFDLPINPLIPTVSYTGQLEFSVSPSLPRGLVFNNVNGVILGTPLATVSSQQFTITATNAKGSSSVTISITVLPAAPKQLLYTQHAVYANYLEKLSIIPIGVLGGPLSSLTFQISPALPAGLTFNPSTGQISGAPTETLSIRSYQITASNSAGSTSAQLTLEIFPLAPSNLVYNATSFSLQMGQSIKFGPVSVSGGPLSSLTFNIVPALPSGLTLSSSTGVISGVPSQMLSTTSYTILASNMAGAITFSFSLTILPNAPTSITYSSSSLTFLFRTQTKISPTVSGCPLNSLRFSVSPALPPGLFLTPLGDITGAIEVYSTTASTHTITATNAAGSVSITFTIAARPAPPASLLYSSSSFVFVWNTDVSDLGAAPISYLGGPLSTLSFSISPALPNGLSLDSSGRIVGSLLVPVIPPTTVYTVTASNSAGTTTSTITIKYMPRYVGIVTYNIPFRLQTGLPYAFPPTYTGGPISSITFSITLGSSLPNGLTLNPATGVISGTPTTRADSFYISIQAKNEANSSPATYSINVNIFSLFCEKGTNPCQNGGTCKSVSEADYSCTCQTGFSGKNCEISSSNGGHSYWRLTYYNQNTRWCIISGLDFRTKSGVPNLPPPPGTASAEGVFGDNYAQGAFRGPAGTLNTGSQQWAIQKDASWIQYRFNTPIDPVEVAIAMGAGNEIHAPHTFYISYSDDGVNFFKRYDFPTSVGLYTQGEYKVIRLKAY